MPKPPGKSLSDEQSICITCGFCCDGTLFLNAHLNHGERGKLPEKIEENSYIKENKEYFRLPCYYFSGKCTIYTSKKADICSSYRCRLLRDFSKGKIEKPDALEIIREALKLRQNIVDQYIILVGDSENISFRKLLAELGTIQNSVNEEALLISDYDMIQVKSNIFEALLIKHFRPAVEFENIMMPYE